MTPGDIITVRRAAGHSFRAGRVPGRVVAVDGDSVTYEVPCSTADGSLARQTCRRAECRLADGSEADAIRAQFVVAAP